MYRLGAPNKKILILTEGVGTPFLRYNCPFCAIFLPKATFLCDSDLFCEHYDNSLIQLNLQQ